MNVPAVRRVLLAVASIATAALAASALTAVLTRSTDRAASTDPSQGTYSAVGWGDLSSGPGPSVTTRIGRSGRALVTMTAYMEAAAGHMCLMGFDVAGPTRRVPAALESLSIGGGLATSVSVSGRSSAQVVISGLARGDYTITAKYAVTLGTCTVASRSLLVEPLRP